MTINYRVAAMGMWRNGSASDFDRHSLSEGCSFEYCHAHFFLLSISKFKWRYLLKGLRTTFELEPAFRHPLPSPWSSDPVIYLQLHRGQRMATTDQLAAFINRHRGLLARERDAEIEQSALLLTACGPKLLEQKGLAILGLGIVSINIGLGGKRWGDLRAA